MVNSTVFFDVTLDSKPLDQVSFKLFANKIPKTAENFHALSRGEKGFGYKVSCCQRIILGFVCLGGDFTHHSGTGSYSICGEKFKDETHPEAHGYWRLVHGKLGSNMNGSQVSVCMAETECDGRRVVWGKMGGGRNNVDAMEPFGSRKGKTSKKITADYGQN